MTGKDVKRRFFRSFFVEKKPFFFDGFRQTYRIDFFIISA